MNNPLKEIPTKQLWIMDNKTNYANRTVQTGNGGTDMCCCCTQLCKLWTAQGHSGRRQVGAEIHLYSTGQSFLPSAGLYPSRQNAFSPPAQRLLWPTPAPNTGFPSAPAQGALKVKPHLIRHQPKCSKGLKDHLKYSFTPMSVTTPGLALWPCSMLLQQPASPSC